jgi:hypothetical protein
VESIQDFRVGQFFSGKLVNYATRARPEKVSSVRREFRRELVRRRIEWGAQVLRLRPLTVAVVTEI